MKAIFIGGPESKKFLNNYFTNLAGKGVEVVRHWEHARRKSFIPSDVDVVIVNQDACGATDRDHMRDICAREDVPFVLGNNSVSETYERMRAMGLIKESAAAAAVHTVNSFFPDRVQTTTSGYVVTSNGGSVYTDGVVLSQDCGTGMRMATAADVCRLSPDTEIVYTVVQAPEPEEEVVSVNITTDTGNAAAAAAGEEKKKEIVMTEDRIEEPTKMTVDVDGCVRLVCIVLKDDTEKVRSTRPVVWGNELFTSMKSLTAVCGIPQANMHTYIASGNPMAGKVIRYARAADVLSKYPSLPVEDKSLSLHREIEFLGDRVYMREGGGGQRIRLITCPDGVVRTSAQAADVYRCVTSTVLRRADSGHEGFRNPTPSECMAAWPSAQIYERTVNVDDDVDDVAAEADVATPSPAPVSSTASAVVEAGSRLMDFIKTPPGTNFLALDVGDAVYLIPASDLARALVPEPRRFTDTAGILSLFPSGVVMVRM